MRRVPTVISALIAALTFSACAFERSGNTVAPSASSPLGTSGFPSLTGAWQSQDYVPTLPNPNTCGNFQYQISSQTSTSISGTLSATCSGGVTVTANASGHVNGTAVTITMSGNASLSGIPSCAFSVIGDGTIEDSGNTLRIPYTGTTCFGPVSGTEVLHRPQSQPPPPPPAPSPEPAPEPAPAPVPAGPADAVNLRATTVVGGSAGDVADWPLTTEITGMDFTNSGVRVDFSKKDGPGRWPEVIPPGWTGGIQYTLWIVENVNGQWYTSGGVEYWYGLQYQGGPPSQFGTNWFYNPQRWGPLANRQPAPGEATGFFVTAGDERAKDVTAVRERSNVVVVPFPTNGGFLPFSALRLRAR